VVVLLRAYLALFLVVLFAIFFGDIARMEWPGQFNLDFLGFLILSGAWTAWRHHFSPAGLVLGLIAFVGGMGFLTIYLLIESARAKGDIRVLLLGARRAAAPPSL
jgi:4-hydroxybenzoate polyprenyltransferase